MSVPILECPDPAGWIARLEAKSVTRGDCIVWTGRLDRNGYGVFKTYGRHTGTHRAAWLARRGPIPSGLVVDHLCRVRACLRVDHMELVTTAENTRRGLVSVRAGQHAGMYGRLKTECVNGHPFDEANTYWASRPDGYTVRICRACRRDRGAANRARRRAA